MADLFANCGDDGDELALEVENEYAKRYDAWREKEERHKLEQKYGENPSEADIDATDSEDSDDEPLEVSEKIEADFLKTLSLLKKKDPRIYDPAYKFFEEGETEKADIKESVIAPKPKKTVSSLAQAFGASDDESDGEIFKVEKQIEPSPEKEDKLKEFLTGKVEHIGNEREEDLSALKSLWSDPKLNDGEAFLRDYILNKKYLAEDEEGPSGKLLDDADLDVDAATIEEQGKFERAYNFRFEEPDQEYLKRYPRTIGGTRPKDDRRARKRAEVRERKEQEKKKKMEEIARLKALKLKEIQEKIARIKEVTGNKDLAFKEEDIEGDFDPNDHDRRMAAIFDDDYYGGQDTEKPVFPDLDEELEIEKNWDHYEEEMGIDRCNATDEGTHCEDENFNMDAEYNPKTARMTLLQEIQETLGKKRRNRKRKTKLAQVLARNKPKFDPTTTEKTYADYMDEYYAMDCEDVIGGDLPTRFKYREVIPNSYGLSIDEILHADDKELNKWASLKKTVKYRPEHIEKGEVKTYNIKGSDINLKRKLIPSLFQETKEEEPAVENCTKKKKKYKVIETVEDIVEPSTSAATSHVNVEEETENGLIQRKNKKSKKKKNIIEKPIEVTQDKVDDSVINGHSNKKKKHKNEEAKGISENTLNDNIESIKMKRKRKHNLELNHKGTTSKDNNKNLKSKLPDEKEIHVRKIKFNAKKQNKGKYVKPVNAKDSLSDERLKAYGLNPKKYRSFLKYKKY